MHRVYWVMIVILAPICCCAGQLLADRSAPRLAEGRVVRLSPLMSTPTPAGRSTGEENGQSRPEPAGPTGGDTTPAGGLVPPVVSPLPPLVSPTSPPTPSPVAIASIPSIPASPTPAAIPIPTATPSITSFSPSLTPTPRPPPDDDNDDDDDDNDRSRMTTRPTPTPTPTRISTPTPTPTSTATPVFVSISGQLFEDVDYNGGGGTVSGGGDVGLPTVPLELYEGSSLLASTVTNETGHYTFTQAPSSRTLTVRVVSAGIGDGDTPPAAGFNAGFSGALAEQTYESNGLTGNGGAGALGGNDPLVDDTATAAGAGPGDTNVTVAVSGADVTGVDFGFAFNLVTNPNNTGQGSLRQTILNANAIDRKDTIVFNIAGAGPYTIRPDPALPVVTDPVVIDGSTQPGFAGRPLIEIDGTDIPNNNRAGLTISAGDSTVRGLVINRFRHWTGLELRDNGNNHIQGNYLGLDVAGTTALSNVTGLYITAGSSNNRIGGTTSADRNVIAGNELFNILTTKGAEGNVIIGNYLGTDAAGAAPVGGLGIHLQSAANIIGGLTPAERNIISGNEPRGVLLNSNANRNTIQGNYIGLDVSGTNPLGNETGIFIINGASNNLVGGASPRAGNIIAHSTLEAGVLIGRTGGVNNRISRNSIFANAGLGIDIHPDDVTLNDGGDSDGGPNTRFNFPVIESATISGGDVTVAGFARPGSVIEFFIAAPDPADFGEGQTYLATLTEGSMADTDGGSGSYGPGPAGQDTTNRFRFTFPAGALAPGDALTATATDAAGNTSEFGPNVVVSRLVQISGRVFEDVDYSGGGGTAFGGGDAGLPNVTVELYDASTLLDSVATGTAGLYTFTNVLPAGTFTVRAVSASIGDADTPPAAGFNPGLSGALAEQTYENDGLTGNGGAGALGGNDPLLDDPATATGAGPGDTNVTVTTAGADVTGVDLGFAFNLVANTNNAGQGSLRQTITNTNVIANAAAGPDKIVFNIAGPPPYTIQPPPALPAVTDPVEIDGTTQPGFTGSPLVELDGTNITGVVGGLTITAGGSTVRGLVINRFGNWAGIELAGGDDNVIQGNYIGLDVNGAAARPNLVGINMANGSSNNLIGGDNLADRNIVSGNSDFNVQIFTGADGNRVVGNYIGLDAAGVTGLGGQVGIHLESNANTIGGPTSPERNIISGHSQQGVMLNSNAANNVVQGNAIGLDGGGAPLGNAVGIYILDGAAANLIGGSASDAANVIAHNSPGQGILFETDAGDNNRITRNSIFANARLGIDINDDDVTINDINDDDNGPNTVFNFPVIESALISGSDVIVTGFARPGSIIEFFKVYPDPAEDFGEGQIYLGTFTEGSMADTDGGVGGYGPGPAGQDTTNRFRFRFTFPAGSLSVGDELTATATDAAGNTSEFGPNVLVN